MSMLAAQVILHPTVSDGLKVLSTTLGRDKVYRAIQFFARFLAWYLISRGQSLEAARWNALKNHLGTARKLLRLGKPVEHLQAALRTAQTTGEIKEQVTMIGRQLGYFGFLAYDALVWANAIRFITLKPDTAKAVNKTSNRFWLAGITFSILHCIFKTARLTSEAQALRFADEKDIGGDNVRQTRLYGLNAVRNATRRQLLMDVLDFWIPAANLELVHFNDGFLGLCGLATSLLALQAQWGSITSAKK
ncbi:unnamed protein product [Peniophora sp. CBMAI 1063]|nr:unnamed protein product [Peniophora sp. CBMAI 1063]